MYSKAITILTLSLLGFITACNNQPEIQTDESSATDKSRTIVIDPNTGERRAPTREELSSIKQSSKTIEPPPAEVIENPDGSTTVIYNGRMRKPLKATVDEDGNKKVTH